MMLIKFIKLKETWKGENKSEGERVKTGKIDGMAL